jgi:hypothetical protein
MEHAEEGRIDRGLTRRSALQFTGAMGLGISSLSLPKAAAATSLADFATSGDASALSVGAEAYGGYFAGIIDTLYRQNESRFAVNSDRTTSTVDLGFNRAPYGLRYALIVSPRTHEPTANVRIATENSDGFNEALTRWNGRTATDQAITQGNLSRLPAYRFIDNLNTNAFASTGSADSATIRGGAIETAAPDDGGSPWYLPALDELDLVYRAFKPTTASNNAGADDRVSSFRGMPAALQPDGLNWSLETQRFGHATGVPAQTTVEAFKSGEPEALAAGVYWSSSSNTFIPGGGGVGQDYTFWCQNFDNGTQRAFGAQGYAVRAVRRVMLYNPYA